MEPNFVLMTLPGEKTAEFIEILAVHAGEPNNLIGWIAGRSDDANYGKAVVYDFPKTKLVDGPLQVEARIDQNAQLSGNCRCGTSRIPRPPRRAPRESRSDARCSTPNRIYLQAERSPMPELRLVVLALQRSPRLRADVRGGDGGAVRQRPIDAGDRAETRHRRPRPGRPTRRPRRPRRRRLRGGSNRHQRPDQRGCQEVWRLPAPDRRKASWARPGKSSKR